MSQDDMRAIEDVQRAVKHLESIARLRLIESLNDEEREVLLGDLYQLMGDFLVDGSQNKFLNLVRGFLTIVEQHSKLKRTIESKFLTSDDDRRAIAIINTRADPGQIINELKHLEQNTHDFQENLFQENLRKQIESLISRIHNCRGDNKC